MSFLKQKMESVSRMETVHLDCLDCDIEIRKITLHDAKRLEKREKEDPIKATHMILSSFIFVDGQPMADEDDIEAVGNMTAEMVNEIATKFAEVNGSDIEELKKKAKSMTGSID